MWPGTKVPSGPTAHGPGGETYMRMNLGAPRPLIKTALDSIAEAVDRA